MADELKITSSKIQYLATEEMVITIAGAGHTKYIEMAYQKVAERCQNARVEKNGPLGGADI